MKAATGRTIPMAVDESTLTKGQLRKLAALRRYVGDELGEEAFGKWLAQQAAAAEAKVDPVATKIEEALAGFANDRKFNLGVYGYTVRAPAARARAVSSRPKTKNHDPVSVARYARIHDWRAGRVRAGHPALGENAGVAGRARQGDVGGGDGRVRGCTLTTACRPNRETHDTCRNRVKL